MSLALRVADVSKQYRIYERPSDRLLESLTRGRVVRHRPFWALKDVSFEVEKGSTVGVVGQNGCGKSTLLQIVAGTLEPTHGSVETDGRVAALLELGAGFNPELTGVENVHMNAALMGFSRRETERLLPGIERFAEIGDFIRQPVKTYSSGMYVRLAFAIAASAEPEIFVVDEALAVGDAVFQHRCLRRIKEMQQRGTTVLFVSHDAAAVRALCTRAVLLNAGRLVADGRPLDVLNHYQKIIMEREEAYEAGRAERTDEHGAGAPSEDESARPLTYTYRHGDGSAEVLSAELLDSSRRRVEVVESGEPLSLRVRVRFHRDVDEPVFGFLIRNRHGVHAYGTNTEVQQLRFGTVRAGELVEVVFSFDCRLGTDTYSFSLSVHSSVTLDGGVGYDWLDGVLFFRVTSATLLEGVANLGASAVARRFQERSERAGVRDALNVG
ncbi:MAG TPA: ABC transporter ATP-binding protein [Pyrinomonadaceae bacterium]|nr:ABC transporter ATP-binding protein [Pyrinomonadaceae bacterium]